MHSHDWTPSLEYPGQFFCEECSGWLKTGEKWMAMKKLTDKEAFVLIDTQMGDNKAAEAVKGAVAAGYITAHLNNKGELCFMQTPDGIAMIESLMKKSGA